MIFQTTAILTSFPQFFQDYYFMPMTIAENICTASDYDREKLFAAFDKAGISEKINSLPLKEKNYMNKGRV